MRSTRDMQIALLSQGYDTGALDGILGARTSAALRDFQRSRGLPADGIAGPSTLAALFDEAGSWPPWYGVALSLIGTRERRGDAANPVILGWAEALGIPYSNDGIPWCGLFAAHCLASGLPSEPLPANPLGARGFLDFGVPLAKPAPGALLVFSRGDAKSSAGHVGFYAGEDRQAFRIVGGNQSDSVSLISVPKHRLLGMRWPRSVPLPPNRGAAVASAFLLDTKGQKTMLDSKPFYASKSFWGGVVAVAASLLGIAGLPLAASDQASIVELLTQAAALAGSALALYGRLVARKTLRT